MIRYVVIDAWPVDQQNADRVLLTEKCRPDFLKGLYNLTGGKIHDGESVIDCAVRELKEETGLDEIGVYDGMVPLVPEVSGVIMGTQSTIYCVRVPVCGRQELAPGPGELEPVEWFGYNDAMNNPKLMPNLRVVLPLMRSGAKDWTIDARNSDWHGESHSLGLTFAGSDEKVTVMVKGLGYFNDREI